MDLGRALVHTGSMPGQDCSQRASHLTLHPCRSHLHRQRSTQTFPNLRNDHNRFGLYLAVKQEHMQCNFHPSRQYIDQSSTVNMLSCCLLVQNRRGTSHMLFHLQTSDQHRTVDRNSNAWSMYTIGRGCMGSRHIHQMEHVAETLPSLSGRDPENGFRESTKSPMTPGACCDQYLPCCPKMHTSVS